MASENRFPSLLGLKYSAGKLQFRPQQNIGGYGVQRHFNNICWAFRDYNIGTWYDNHFKLQCTTTIICQLYTVYY
jgi:hypothetical protein